MPLRLWCTPPTNTIVLGANRSATDAHQNRWCCRTAHLCEIVFVNGDIADYRYQSADDNNHTITLHELVRYQFQFDRSVWSLSELSNDIQVIYADGGWLTATRVVGSIARGQRRYATGAIYHGDLLDDDPHGVGVWHEADTTHSGTWFRGLRHGFATYVDSAGTFCGYFHQDQRCGVGFFRGVLENHVPVAIYAVFTNNHHAIGSAVVGTQRYLGELVDYHFHGRGLLLYDITECAYNDPTRAHEWQDLTKTQRHYSGSFEHSRRHGFGKMTDPSEQLVYQGQWVDDKRHGEGHWILHNQICYDGMWDTNRRHGQGQGFAAPGVCFTGEWSDGAPAIGTWQHGSLTVQGAWTGEASIAADEWRRFGLVFRGVKVMVRTKLGELVGVDKIVYDRVACEETYDTSAEVVALVGTEPRVWKRLQRWYDPQQLTIPGRPFPCDHLIPKWIWLGAPTVRDSFDASLHDKLAPLATVFDDPPSRLVSVAAGIYTINT